MTLRAPRVRGVRTYGVAALAAGAGTALAVPAAMGALHLVPVAMVVAAGVAFGVRGGTPAPVAAGVALLAWILAAIASGRRGRRAPALAAWAALLAAAVARGAAHHDGVQAERAPFEGPQRLEWCRVEVASHPAGEPGERSAVVRCDSAPGGVVPGTRLWLRFPRGLDVHRGERLEVLARLQAPPGPRNPGAASARERWAAHGVAATGRVFAVRVLAAADWGLPHRLRAGAERTLYAFLDPLALEMAVPTVLGDWGTVTPETGADLRRAGLTHLLALSGLHVAWFAGVARHGAALLRLPLAARSCAGAVAALFYLMLAGFQPSLARAACSEAWTTAAGLAGRAVDGRQSLAGAVVVLLALEPGWVGDVGFQLSCAATAGLVCFGSVARRGLSGAWRLVLAPALPTLCAQLGALPWLVAHFHAVSVTGLLANLVAVPVAGALLSACWLGLVLAPVAEPLAALCFSAADAAALALRDVSAVAALPVSSLWITGHDPAGEALLFAALFALFLLARPAPTLAESSSWNSPMRVRLATLALALLVSGGLLALSAPTLRPPPGRIWAWFLDVGQGDACALAFPDGAWWLVDTGPRSPRSDAGEGVVLPFLRWAGVRRLEALALTHADADHTGGSRAVLRSLPVAAIVTPAPTARVPGPAAALGWRLQVRRAARGDTLRGSPEVRVLWPPRADSAAFASDNRRCLVLQVGEGLLLTGDADTLVEHALESGPVALLKVAHHGSRSSNAASWLAGASPRWAVISCGAGNPFGHPDPAVVARLRAAGARVWRTDSLHAAWFEWDAGQWRVRDWRGRTAPWSAAAAAPGGAIAPRRASGGGAGSAVRAGNPLARPEPAQ